MPRSFSICWVGVCVLSMLLTAPISADDLDHIAIEGAINDISQQRIVNARVTAKATSTAQERTTTSDAEGRYRFTKLLPGEYELRVEVSGFRTVQYKFNAVAGTIMRRDFKLEVAALNEQITVVPPAIKLRLTRRALLSAARLPSGRLMICPSKAVTSMI